MWIYPDWRGDRPGRWAGHPVGASEATEVSAYATEAQTIHRDRATTATPVRSLWPAFGLWGFAEGMLVRASQSQRRSTATNARTVQRLFVSSVSATIRGRKGKYNHREHGEHREELIDRIIASCESCQSCQKLRVLRSSSLFSTVLQVQQSQTRCAPALPFSTTNEARVLTAASGFETSATTR